MREHADPRELGRRAGVEHVRRTRRPEQARAARDVAVSVQHEVAASSHPRQQVAPPRQLRRENKTEPRRQALHRVLLRHREHVMVKRDDDQVAGRCRVQRDIDGLQIAVVQTPMTIQPGPIVRGRRIDAHDVQPGIAGALHARPGHDRVRDVVAQAIVVAGDGDEPPVSQQRRERAFVGVQLAPQPAVREIARGDDVVDVRFDERGAQARRVRVVLFAAPDVQIGDMGESTRVVHAP